MKVPDFKGYIQVPSGVFILLDLRTLPKMFKDIKTYPITEDKPEWLYDLPENMGVPSIEYKRYIILDRGQYGKN